jgi:hypothetical protein
VRLKQLRRSGSSPPDNTCPSGSRFAARHLPRFAGEAIWIGSPTHVGELSPQATEGACYFPLAKPQG